MIPDISLRIQSMQRAMTEVIIPALRDNMPMAHEQANVIVVFLKLIASQHAHAYLYELAEVREFAALVTDLLAVADGGEQTVTQVAAARHALEAASPIAAIDIPPQAEVAAQARALRHAADVLVRAAEQDGTSEFRRASDQLVLAQSANEITRIRVWSAAAGFDPEASTLPPLSTLLSRRN